MSALAARLAFFAFFAIAAIAPMRPLRDYDYHWHLATGRWIHEHGAVPRADPFGVATDRVPWIDGEWLFQYLLYPLHSAFGANGIVLLRALLLGALFTALLVWTTRRTQSLGLSLGICTIAWFAASWAFSERPATFATAFVVLAVWMSLRMADGRWQMAEHSSRRHLPSAICHPLLYALLTIVWINFHPSALLAPVIAILGFPSLRRVVLASASALALLVNPYGIEAILAPVRLTRWVTSGVFHNIEWQPATPATHPFLFLMIALTLVAFGINRERRRYIPQLLLLLLFGAMAIRFLRNHGMFYSVWPLLLAPMLPPLTNERLQRILAIASFAFLSLFLISSRPSMGVDGQWLPVFAAEELKMLQPAGNIFTAGHFGGYLIWTFYPERRIVNDGRNELHHTLLREYAAARRTERAWRALLDKYRITTAVADYEPNVRQFYPPSEWALVTVDPAALVFARRAAWPGRDLEKLELRANAMLTATVR